MCYRVAVRKDGQDDVIIKVDPKDFTIEEDMHEPPGVEVKLEYSQSKLHRYDPTGYHALLDVWPHEAQIVLSKRDEGDQDGDGQDGEWMEVFAGDVTKIGTDDYDLCVAAHQAAAPIPDPLVLDVTQDTGDPDGLTVQVRAQNDGEGEVSIDFGDDTPTQVHPGDGSALSHAYAAGGTYTVSATDTDQPDRTAQQVVTVPFPSAELELSVAVDPTDATRMTARVLVDNKGAGEVSIDFGDGTATVTNPGDGATPSNHLYAAAGSFTVTATDTDQPERTAQQVAIVPFPA